MYGIKHGETLGGKSIIVTGGASGIGRSTVLLLAAAGANVMAGDRDLARLRETQDLSRSLEGQVDILSGDVSDEAYASELTAKAVERFGRLDGAANIAGIVSSGNELLHETSGAAWQRMIDVNLSGVFFGMKHQLAEMVRQGSGGTIVNVSSTSALKGLPFLADYCAAKSGLVGLARAAAVEYAAHGIRINTIFPGATDTPLLRERIEQQPHLETIIAESSLLGRSAHPDEIAYSIRWLLSPEASFITGATLAVDGGHTAG